MIGERTEEVNLAELLKVARREFNDQDSTLDEGLLQAQWPQLRQRLSTAMNNWIDVPVEVVSRPSINHQLPNYQLPNMSPIATARSVPQFITLRPPVMLPTSLRAQPLTVTVVSGDRHDPLAALSLPVMGNPITAPPRAQVQVQVQASAPAPATAPPAAPAPTTPAEPLWKSRCRARFQVKTSDVWSSL